MTADEELMEVEIGSEMKDLTIEKLRSVINQLKGEEINLD